MRLNTFVAETKVERTRLLNCDGAKDAHINADLAGPFDRISARVAEIGTVWIRTTGPRRARRRGIKPLQCGAIVNGNGRRITSARNEPLTPRVMSKVLPSTRGVTYSPLAMVKSPLYCQLDRACIQKPVCANRRISPKGKS